MTAVVAMMIVWAAPRVYAGLDVDPVALRARIAGAERICSGYRTDR
jgi:hypothetical protein